MKKMKNQKGFTLVELIVVIAILAVLAILAVIAFAGLTESARIERVNTDMASAATFLNHYESTHGNASALLPQLLAGTSSFQPIAGNTRSTIVLNIGSDSRPYMNTPWVTRTSVGNTGVWVVSRIQ